MSSPNSYWYWRALKKAWVLNEGTTNKLPLPERGHLSGIAIHSACLNKTKHDTQDRPYPIQRHTKFRILGNGNFEIINASGPHLKAVECWNDDVDPKGFYSQISTHYQRNYLTLPFGRYMGDEKYGLILEKFEAGVEFEETNDYNIVNWTDTKQTLDLYGLFRKRPEADCFAEGFFRKRVIIEKDTANEVEYGVKLPTLNKLKNIYLFSEGDVASGVETGIPIDSAKYIWLTAKSKEELIIDNARNREFCYFQHNHYGRLFRTHVTYAGGADGSTFVDSMIYRGYCKSGIPHGPVVADDSVMTIGGDTRIKDVYGLRAGVGSANCFGEVDFNGIALHGLTPLLVVDPYAEEDDYLDAGELKDVYVAITEGNNTGTWWVVLDELQKFYPS